LKLNILPTLISHDTTRKNCSHTKYSKIIYHTHPKNAKSYPSVEDIMKITKIKDESTIHPTHNNKIIKTSLIFTDCGIWELYCNDNKNLDKNHYNQITKYIEGILKKIYEKYSKTVRHDNNGRIIEVKGGGRYVVNDDYLKYAIKNIEDALHYYFPSYKIYFSEWNNLNEYKLHKSSKV
jgi:hypothetical protein